jgi:hypothetical protein
MPPEVTGPLAVRWLRMSVRSEVALTAVVLVAAAVLSGLPLQARSRPRARDPAAKPSS